MMRNNNVSVEIGELLNVASTTVRLFDEFFDLEDLCTCPEHYEGILKEVLVLLYKLKNRLFELYHDQLPQYIYIALLQAYYLVERAILLIELVLKADICCSKDEVCWILEILRDINSILCNIVSLLALAFSRSKEKEGA